MKIIRLLIVLSSVILSFAGISFLNGSEEEIDVLRVAQESSPSNVDPGLDASEGVRGIDWNIYDRLVTFDVKMLPEGVLSYDYQKIIPSLAKSWEYDKDGSSLIFHLHKDATFHDGAPVTAEDVRWSLARAISVAEFSTSIMKVGGFDNPDQLVIIDDHTIKIKLSRRGCEKI